MRSRIGGRDRDNDMDLKDVVNGKTSHEENSRSAMELATRIWPETDVRHCRESASEEYHEAHVKAILAAARESQRQDKRGGPVLENADNQPSVKVKYEATKHDEHRQSTQH